MDHHATEPAVLPADVSGVAAPEFAFAIVEAASRRFGGGFAADVHALVTARLSQPDNGIDELCADNIRIALAEKVWSRLQALPG